MKGRKTFNKNAKRNIFDKLREVPGKDKKIWRKDVGNEVICFPSHGDENSKFGWNIHHINENPVDNSLSNLEAVSYKTHQVLH